MISFELWVIMNDGSQFDQTAEFSKTILAPFFDTHIRSSWYSFSVLLLGKVVWRICVRLAELAVLDRIRFLMGLIWLATSSLYIKTFLNHFHGKCHQSFTILKKAMQKLWQNSFKESNDGLRRERNEMTGNFFSFFKLWKNFVAKFFGWFINMQT